MGFFSPLRYSFFFFFFLFCCCGWVLSSASQEPSFSYSFEGFGKGAVFDEDFALFGDAVGNETTVRMAPTLAASSGVVLHRNPIRFGRNPSFSTDFTFSISPEEGGNGVAFFIAPGNVPKESLCERLFGLSPGVFAVEFDTSTDVESHDLNGNHVGIDIGSSVSIASFNVSAINLTLNSGEKLHSWIDFDGDLKFLEVRLNKSGGSRPSDPFVSYPLDLSGLIWQDSMFVGIASSSGNTTQVSSVYSWRFGLRRSAPYLMHSDPLDPRSFMKPPKQPVLHIGTDTNYLPVILMALAFGAACGAAVAFLVLLVWSASVDRQPVAPVEYSPHPAEFGYKKIVVGDKGMDRGKK